MFSGGFLARPYQGIYGGPLLTTNGSFLEFSLTADRERLQEGYWRFNVEGDNQDDRRAHNLDLYSPERILEAALRDDGTYNEACDLIFLCWVPGPHDTFQYCRVGTAKQHIALISDERMRLGLSVSFQGQTPVYPNDPASVLYERRYNLLSHGGKDRNRITTSPDAPEIHRQDMQNRCAVALTPHQTSDRSFDAPAPETGSLYATAPHRPTSLQDNAQESINAFQAYQQSDEG
jgi:hypothetical protein